MFAGVLKEHKVRRQRAQRELEARKRDVTLSAENVSAAATQQLNGAVARVVSNQNALEAEAKTLQTQSARFAKQTKQWLTLYKQLNDQLKECGDVRNWAVTIERDMLSVASALAHTVSLATGQPVQPIAAPPAPQPLAASTAAAPAAAAPAAVAPAK